MHGRNGRSRGMMISQGLKSNCVYKSKGQVITKGEWRYTSNVLCRVLSGSKQSSTKPNLVAEILATKFGSFLVIYIML